MERAISALGIFVMIGLAWACSSNRRAFPWRIVVTGVALQFLLAVLALRTPVGRWLFVGVNDFAAVILHATEAGSRFMFGSLLGPQPPFVLVVFPIIIFMGSIFGVLYHLGVVQWVVGVLARALSRSMRISGAESLASVANIFVGMAEAALVVRPYVGHMTRSELFTLMATGMATVAGSVLFAYVGMLGQEFAGHLVTASILSAPAGILIAKVMFPETESPETRGPVQAHIERRSANLIDAASIGAIDGLRIAAYVGAMLIAFVSLVALLNFGLGALGGWIGIESLSFERLLGFVLAPLAFLMGIPWHEAPEIGALLGVKTVLNEFLAYQDLAVLMEAGAVSRRSALIASYALCGFANFGSLAILLGAIGSIAPDRRAELARLGLYSIVAGSLATFMTGCVAGLLADA